MNMGLPLSAGSDKTFFFSFAKKYYNKWRKRILILLNDESILNF